MGGAKWGRDHGFVIIPLGLGIAEAFPPSAVAALSQRRQFYWIHCFSEPSFVCLSVVILTGTRQNRWGIWVNFKQKIKLCRLRKKDLCKDWRKGKKEIL